MIVWGEVSSLTIIHYRAPFDEGLNLLLRITREPALCMDPFAIGASACVASENEALQNINIPPVSEV